jgi:hypothetical protein
MTTVLTHSVTMVHPGDVMLNHASGHLVDVVIVSDTHVQYRDRADYSGPLGSMDIQDFVHGYSWVRNSPVLYQCWLSGH